MWSSLSDPVRGSLSLLILAFYTLFWSALLFGVGLLKALMPVAGWRTACTRVLNGIAQLWVASNRLGLALTKDIRYDVEGLKGLRRDAWYLLISNHQSMVDIVVLQNVFHGRVPPLKFFLKRELLWVPVMGAVWWLLDFPFMKRTSSARRDLEAARLACEKFKALPVTVTNFVEGTRFTPAKHHQQNSPYTHLLKPKSAGLAIVLSTMGEQLETILDVTIAYPRGVTSLWAFLCSRSMEIKVRVRQLAVGDELRGDFMADRELRRRVSTWLDEIWQEKDLLLGDLVKATPANSAGQSLPDDPHGTRSRS
jgi:1-acyl-sn-glycerol-3-phosphate acyltransferase